MIIEVGVQYCHYDTPQRELKSYFFIAKIIVVPGRILGISPWVSIDTKPALFSQSEYCDNVQHSPSGVCFIV